ncbi:MAG: twin-arginine translocase TatA/TatE family subunit [Rickettsiales bacterium TMED251]|nr:MAG: twin-arginine translocase TatA/TatE family subunit [Rickettsiales bacterium TMED251]|tara:strand:- start:1288 stop:1518 length:231 start_codon:yes stop_codon:yes gene_type:complete
MGISIWQIVLVLVIIVILFGAGKIPRVMGDIAKGIKSFKAGMKEGENEEIETEAETIDDTKTKETKAKRTSKKSKK